MTKPLFITLLASVAMATPALAKNQQTSFTRDDVTYVYSIAKAGKATIYKGHASTGVDFRLVVRGNTVTGTTNGVPVRFKVPTVEIQAKAKSDATGVLALN